MDAPAPGGIAEREYDIMLPAEGEHFIEMFDKRVLALVHEHECTGDRAAFRDHAKEPFFPAKFVKHLAADAMDDNRTDALVRLHPECGHDVISGHLFQAVLYYCLVDGNGGDGKCGVGKDLFSYGVDIPAHREIADGIGSECLQQ